MFKFIFRVILFSTLLLVAAEITFRTIIPASRRPLITQDYENGFLHYDQALSGEGHFASGRFSQVHSKWSINNAGFNSHRDFIRADQRQKPCIAYFGSSFVEGFFNDVDKQIAVPLENLLNNQYEVYNFGFSNSVPSEHLMMARHVDEVYDPEVMIIFSAPWHMNLSLKSHAARYRLSYENGEVVERKISKYHNSKMRFLMKKSALMRYIVYNIGIEPRINLLPVKKKSPQVNAANRESVKPVDDTRLEKVVDYIVSTATKEHPDKVIIFATGYTWASNEPPVIEKETLLIRKACEKYDCHEINVTELCHEDFKVNGKSFNFAHDGHWNEYAFEVIAAGIHKYLKDNKLLAIYNQES